jgi:hypothetical protein
MSLFKPYNYKDRPEEYSGRMRKNRFFIFWEIYFRKFWRFVTVNLIYFVVTLPMLLYFYYTANGYFAAIMGDSYTDLLPGVGFIAALVSGFPKWLDVLLLALSAVLYGPIKMGVTYVFRNFTREEHAWISDIWDKAWENKWQGLVLGILDILLSLLLTNNIFGSFASDSSGVGVVLLISRYLSAVLLVLLLFVRHYSYLIAISVELPLRGVIRNSCLFIIMGLGRNILALLACAAIWAVTLFTLPIVSVVAIPLLTYSLAGFASVYICYPTVKKYIIVPALAMQEEQAQKQNEPELE